jgi:hypothetical protein
VFSGMLEAPHARRASIVGVTQLLAAQVCVWVYERVVGIIKQSSVLGLKYCEARFLEGLGFGTEAEDWIGGLGFNLIGCAHYDCCALISRFRLIIEVLVYLGD